jgi:Domain of unknown function (DUF932)
MSAIANQNPSRSLRPGLSEEWLRRKAPSVFAEEPMQGVSHRYSFVPTSQLVSRLRDSGWVPVDAFEQPVRVEERRGFQKHMIRFQRQDVATETNEYTAELVLVNSHDRSSAYHLHAGLFRFVCGNGMIIADATFEKVAIRHAGFTPEEVVSASFRILDSVPKLTENVESFRARALTPVEQRAFAESAIILKYDELEHAPLGAETVLTPRRYEDNRNDLWSTFNRVQENLVRGGLKDWSKRKENGKRHTRTRPVTGIDENVKLNKALWHLAEVLKSGGSLPAVSN